MKRLIILLSLAFQVGCAATAHSQAIEIPFTTTEGFKLHSWHYSLVSWVPDEYFRGNIEIWAESYIDTATIARYTIGDESVGIVRNFNLRDFLAYVRSELKNPNRDYDLGEEDPHEGARIIDVGNPRKFFLAGNTGDDFDADHQAHIVIYIGKKDEPKLTVR